MGLVGFQYEPVSLGVNEFCFDEKHSLSNPGEKSRKSQNVTEWCRCEKSEVTNTNVECLSRRNVEDLGYFQLSNMRYNNQNSVTKRAKTTVLSERLHKF